MLLILVALILAVLLFGAARVKSALGTTVSAVVLLVVLVTVPGPVWMALAAIAALAGVGFVAMVWQGRRGVGPATGGDAARLAREIATQQRVLAMAERLGHRERIEQSRARLDALVAERQALPPHR